MLLSVITAPPPRSFSWRWLAAAACLGVRLAAQTPDPGVTGTLPEDYLPALRPMLTEALAQSPDLINSELAVEVARASKLQNGISQLLPRLNSQVQYGVNSQAISSNVGQSNRNEGFTYTLNAAQPVFQWGALKNNLAAWQVQLTISEKNYAEAYRGYASNLRHQYLGLVGQKLGLRNARFNLKLKNDALALANERLKSGTLPAGAIAGPQLDQAQAQLALDQAEQDYEVARRALARQLGQKDLPDDAIAADVPAPTYSPEAAQALLAEFLRDRGRGTAAVQLSLLNLKNWDLQYRIARVNQLPKISVQAALQQQNQSQLVGNSVQQYFVFNEQYYVVANWAIFDGLFTRGEKRADLYQKQIAQRSVETATDGVLENAQNMAKSLEFAWRQLEIKDKLAQIAQGEFEQDRDAVKHGNLPTSALDAQQNAINLSQAELVAARSAFLGAWSDFVSLVGHDPAMHNLSPRYVHPN